MNVNLEKLDQQNGLGGNKYTGINPIIWLDLETTGTDIHKDTVLEIAVRVMLHDLLRMVLTFFFSRFVDRHHRPVTQRS